MTVKTAVVTDAGDPKQGMTLDELAEFVEQARKHDIPGAAHLHVRVNMRGGIWRIETKP